jgi:hypothetical protein
LQTNKRSEEQVSPEPTSVPSLSVLEGAAPVKILVRNEASGYSWKFVSESQTFGPFFGQVAPKIGDAVSIPTKPPIDVVVAEVGDHLNITAGDLAARDKFDPRRVYTTTNGTSVVYKRTEGTRVVLWSYKINGEIMVSNSVEMSASDRVAEPVASGRRPTQKLLAAYLIGQNPVITPQELTAQLAEAFPEAGVGKRHGPHYLSQSRRGRLPEPPDSDPRDW